MSIAVWTDSQGRVERIHYKPSEVDTSDAEIVDVDSVPSANTKGWVEDTMFYDSANGFYHESTDPFEGLAFTEQEKQNVYDAVQRNDMVEIRNIIENALKT